MERISNKKKEALDDIKKLKKTNKRILIGSGIIIGSGSAIGYGIKKYKDKKEKNFSKVKDIEEKTPNGMINAGKVGLMTAGGIGAASAVQGGRAAILMPGLAKDAQEVMKLRNNKNVRGLVKNKIKDSTKFVSGIDKVIINNVRKAEDVYNNTKFSKLDRLQRGINALNTVSKQSRTVLNNAENWAKVGAESMTKDLALNNEERKIVDRGVRAVGKLGKAGIRIKNAKILGKTAAVIGGVSGASYLHGKELQNYNLEIDKNRKRK